MRGLLAMLVLLLAAPLAAAEFGPVDAQGWPINVDGESTDPGDPVNRPGDATLYPYWPVLTAEVQRLAQDHPDKVRLTSAGTSTLGLDLWMLEIADFDRIESGQGLPLDDREVIWVDGGTHSNEYSGVYFALAVAQFLLDGADQNDTARWILENRHTWVMPMVNPDGSFAMGRLNANGVNINRNYPVVWDGEGHDPLLNNRGAAPASEVETQINIQWFNRTHPDYYASVHCCGNLWLYPYGEEGVDPVDQDMLQRVCDEAFAAVREDCGPIWSTIYPASGSSVDTAYAYTGAVAFGYEMSGRGAVALWGQPVTFEDVFIQERESWAGLLHAFQNVHLYGGHPTVVHATATTEGHQVTLRNDGYGPIASGMAHIGDAVVDFEALTPGQEVTLHIPAPSFDADQLVVHYQKRLMEAPMGEVRHPLPERLAPAASEDAPLPLLAALAAIGAALVLARRPRG